MEETHAVEIVIDEELQNVRHMGLMSLEDSPTDGTILQETGGLLHNCRTVEVNLEEQVISCVVAIKRPKIDTNHAVKV